MKKRSAAPIPCTVYTSRATRWADRSAPGEAAGARVRGVAAGMPWPARGRAPVSVPVIPLFGGMP
ncbi:hypothetical protein CATMIT_01948 [Catenibacterium mitsuokai DSM 15897]|nr:hypothetical protein CATMIT_01948 [Catenibacterium mitsuokai DSM 15897]